MDFRLTKEQTIIQKEARSFAQKEIVPLAKEEGFKPDLVAKMGDLGFFGCAFPPKYGGSDSGFLAHSIVCEEISRIDSGLRSLFNFQDIAFP
jgi:glutaryl-CoA dehydrogenase (non-decarboxylating)